MFIVDDFHKQNHNSHITTFQIHLNVKCLPKLNKTMV